MQFTVATSRPSASRSASRRNPFARQTTRLWIAQGVLAAVFLMAGLSKLVMPAEELTRDTWLSAEFIRFIGVCETLGAVGLVLPGLLRIRRELTPVAAAGLVIIMIGATVITAVAGSALAVIPALVGLLAAYVVRGRFADVH